MRAPDGYEQTVYGAQQEVAAQLPADVYRALPVEERVRHWYAAWDPWKWAQLRDGWDRLMQVLADREWHEAQEARCAVYEVQRAIGRSHRTAWMDGYHLIRHTYRAGLTEEDRLNGSTWIVDRRIRLKEHIPERFLVRPADMQPNGCALPLLISRSPRPVDLNSGEASAAAIPLPPTGRSRAARNRRWRRRPAPDRPQRRAS